MPEQIIRILEPLRCGGAIYVGLEPPCEALEWRLLRKAASAVGEDEDPFASVADPAAEVLISGREVGTVDWYGLRDGVPYYYGGFWWDGAAWTASDPLLAVPAAVVQAPRQDPQEVIRERLEHGLNALLAAGHLRHPRNRFEVLTAPPQVETAVFPLAVVQLLSDTPQEHVLGDMLDIRESDADGTETEYDGWFSRYQIRATAFALNPDERRLLRRALKEIIIRNKGVFQSAGMMLVDCALSDTEDFQTSYSAPLYLTLMEITCTAASVIAETWAGVSAVVQACCREETSAT
jgi:hypothetical protein